MKIRFLKIIKKEFFMKKTILVLMFMFAVTLLVAQTDAVAYIIGAETQSEIIPPASVTVETILVQLNDDIDVSSLGTTWTWDDVFDDFQILDGTTVLAVTSATNSGTPDDNYIILEFTNSSNYGPAEFGLDLHYSQGVTPIPLINGEDLQTTSTAVNINDGIHPFVIDYKLTSNFTGNQYFADQGDVVTLTFTANEGLANIPSTPTVTFSVADADWYSGDISASMVTPDPVNTLWKASFTVPANALNGKVNFYIEFRDVHANENTLGTFDVGSDGNSVWIKTYDPNITYAGETYTQTTLPAPVTGDNEPAIYLWNVFNTIQAAIDGVVAGTANADATSYVYVAAGTYTEDPTINKSLTLLGAQNGVVPLVGGRPGGESIINGEVYIYADDVIVNGFEIPDVHDAFMGRNDRALHTNVQILYNYIHSNVAGAVGINLICDSTTELVTTFENYVISYNYINLSTSTRVAIGLMEKSPDSTKEYVYDGLEISYNEITVPSGMAVWTTLDPASTTFSVEDAVIEYNDIHDCMRGLNLDNLVNVDINNNEFTVIDFSSATINVLGGSITDNSFTQPESTIAASYMLSLLGTAGGSPIGDHDVTVSGNDFYYNNAYTDPGGYLTNGARVLPGCDASTITFTNNNFDDGGAGVGALGLRNYVTTTELDADLNWWGDETGPLNATYNPQGGGGAVSDYVLFSHWWTTVGTDYGAIEGSSEIAINQTIEAAATTITNVTSETDGTISLDVTTTYSEDFDINLPHEFLNNALLETNVAFNTEATVTVAGWGYTLLTTPWVDIPLGGISQIWLSELLGIGANSLWNQPDGPTFPENDVMQVVLKNLDDTARTFTVKDIGALGFSTGVFGNYYDDSLVDADFVCDYNNSYRGFTPFDGFILGQATFTLQDPMQVALNGTFDIVDATLACNVADEVTFSTQQVFATFPETPALSNDWLTDAWVATNVAVPNGTYITIEGWGQTWNKTMNGNDLGFWLSELTGVQTPLAGHSGLTVDYDITIAGLDFGEYTLEMWSVTAAAGNFDYTLLTSDESSDQYQLGYDTIDFIDPIQYAIDGSALDIVDATLVCSTQDVISFDVGIDYPLPWTTNPELPVDLLVDALIETDSDVPDGTKIQVFFGGSSLGFYTAGAGEDFWWFSEIISGTPTRPALKDESGNLDWTVEISNLDDAPYVVTISSIASDFVDPADFVNEYVLGTDTITIQDPIQYAIEHTVLTVDAAVCLPNDVVEFDMTMYYNPALDFTTTPTLPTELLTDCRITITPALVENAVLELIYSDNGTTPTPSSFGYAPLTLGESEFYLSELIFAMNPSIPTRTPLIELTGAIQYWTLRLQDVGTTYTDYAIDFEVIASDFVEETDEVTWVEFLLDEEIGYELSEPIQYLAENTTLEIDTVNPLIPIDAGITFDIDVDYADLPDGNNPGYPASPYDPLYVDALIELGEMQTFPADTDVTITKYVDGSEIYTWEDLTLPGGVRFAWLSEILVENRALVTAVDGTTETWGIAIDDMDYENYDFTVTSIAATADNFTPESPTDEIGFSLVERFELSTDTVADVQIPYFTTLEIELKQDAGTWYDCDSQSYDDEFLTLGADIELDVAVGTVYVNLKNTTATNVELAEGYYGFTIDTENYPAPHELGFMQRDEPNGHDYTYLEYWASRDVYDGCSGTWEPTMWQIIDGQLPFFYIKVTDVVRDVSLQTYELIDGLTHILPTSEEYMRMEGDHFLGDYIFTGYVYSKSHNLPASDSFGVDELKSDLITVNITLQDEVETTYPDFTVLGLQDQVQGSNYWIDLETVEIDHLSLCSMMYLNEDVDYYELDINDAATTTTYDFAPQYQPMYLYSVEYEIVFLAYWNAKGVNAGATGGWEEIMWDIINGLLPMFYIDVDDDQTMTLIDGLSFALNHLMPGDVDAAFRINGTYPLGEYVVGGGLVGINGTMDEFVMGMYLEKSEVVDYDLIIWEDGVGGISITEHTDLRDDDVNMVVNTPYDMTVKALDVNREMVSDYEQLILLGSNWDAYLNYSDLTYLRDGTVNILNGIQANHVISSEDMLYITITDSLFNTDVTLTEGGYIVEEATYSIAPPGDCSDVVDFPGDQGGFVFATICLSPNDPFYVEGESGIPQQEPYIDHYTIERFSEPTPADDGTYEWFESINCYDTVGEPIVTGPLATIASDDEYEYRITAVYVPNSDQTEKKAEKVKKEMSPTDEGSQSAWVDAGSAAAADNLPAYANIKIFLEGAYVNGGTMYTNLLLSGAPVNAVDEVELELRTSEGGVTVKQASGYVLSDGSVVDEAGNSSFPFYYTTGLQYYFVISHRNHLAIMSAGTHAFSDLPTDSSIDLTVFESVYGNGVKEIETGVYAMYDGDVDGDGTVSFNDAIEVIANISNPVNMNADVDLDNVISFNDAIKSLTNNGKSSAFPGQSDLVVVNKRRVESSSSRENEEATLEIKNVVVVPDVSYTFDVYITRNTANWTELYTNVIMPGLFFKSQLAFDFNGLALNNVTTPYLHPSIASVALVETANDFNIVIDESGTPGIGNLGEEKFVTFTMDIVDDSQTASLEWKPASTNLQTDGGYYGAGEGAGKVELLGEDDTPLPVVLSSFTASYSNNSAVLNWVTESETDNLGFNLYRSESENGFENSQQINSTLIPGMGTTTEPTNYSFVDEYPVIEGHTYWYWLESVSLTNDLELFDPISLEIPITGMLPTMTILEGNYPNPFNPETAIAFNVKENEVGTLAIYNLRGQIIMKERFEAGNHQYLWNAQGLASGIYFYKLTSPTTNITKKMLLLK
jgi:Secretion system C-terminal sorting domain